MFPPEIYFSSAGGAAGWGTLCGALFVAGNVINLVTPLSDCMPIYSELIGWYTLEPFPSNRLDDIAKVKNQGQSVSNSPLCHISIGRWCEVTGLKVGTPEHVDRCAKLTGDVAARTVELLNLHSSGKFKAAYSPSQKVTACMGCHGKGGEQSDAFGKMSCTECHEPHES